MSAPEPAPKSKRSGVPIRVAAAVVLTAVAALSMWLVLRPSAQPRPNVPAADTGPQISNSQLKRTATEGCRQGARQFTGRTPLEVVVTDTARVSGDLWELTCVTDLDKLRLRATVQAKVDGTTALWRVEVIERTASDRAAAKQRREPLNLGR